MSQAPIATEPLVELADPTPDEPAGMRSDPRHLVEDSVRDAYVKVARSTLIALASTLDADNAPRVLVQIGKTSLDFRTILSRFGAHTFPEHDGGRRGGAYAASGGIVAGLPFGGNRETMGVKGLKELVTIAQMFMMPRQLNSLLEAAANAKKNGLDDVAESLSQQAKDLAAQMATAQPVDTTTTAAAVGELLTQTTPDELEVPMSTLMMEEDY